jgi:tRNA (guanine37-N1)-methyltransferase
VCGAVLIDIITAFPALFGGVFSESMVKRAQDKELVEIRINDLRDYSDDRFRRVDDYPYGGGPGMILKPEPFFKAVSDIKNKSPEAGLSRTILMSPQGELLSQHRLKGLRKFDHLIILCGHYEGVDDRVRLFLAEEAISIGDYVLTGGEIPAMVLVDALVRLIPGVLNPPSLDDESFTGGLLEYPQYTRPQEYEGMSVPDVLLSGNHENIRNWRYNEALKLTSMYRPELLHKKGITAEKMSTPDKKGHPDE